MRIDAARRTLPGVGFGVRGVFCRSAENLVAPGRRHVGLRHGRRHARDVGDRRQRNDRHRRRLHQGCATSTQSGTDTLLGVENVIAGSGADTIVIGSTVNVLTGGASDDTFRFETASAADGDTVADLEPGDRLDFSGIDAVLDQAGDEAFTIVTGAAATAAGQLAVSYQHTDDVTVTIVEGHVDADGQADSTVRLDGACALDGGNTIL